MLVINRAAVSLVRRVTHAGRSYFVASAVMAVPGVIAGSQGALYYPAEELSRNPAAWDHSPVTVGHPSDGGRFVSARSPKVLERYGVGAVYNTKFDGRLVAEAWVSVDDSRRVDRRVHDALDRGVPMELSTGLFVNALTAPPGSAFHGRRYDAIATNHRPDHLALLPDPDQAGACSLQMGCGLAVNVNGESPMQQFVTLPVETVLALLGHSVNNALGTPTTEVPLPRTDWSHVFRARDAEQSPRALETPTYNFTGQPQQQQQAEEESEVVVANTGERVRVRALPRTDFSEYFRKRGEEERAELARRYGRR